MKLSQNAFRGNWDVGTFKAVEAGMCMHLGLLLGLFWYAQVPRYVLGVDLAVYLNHQATP